MVSLTPRLMSSRGRSRMYSDDLEQLEAGMLLYDALYRWCRDATDETHNWPYQQAKDLVPELEEVKMRKIALISLLGMTLAVPSSSVAAEVDGTAVDKALGKTAA